MRCTMCNSHPHYMWESSACKLKTSLILFQKCNVPPPVHPHLCTGHYPLNRRMPRKASFMCWRRTSGWPMVVMCSKRWKTRGQSQVIPLGGRRSCPRAGDLDPSLKRLVLLPRRHLETGMAAEIIIEIPYCEENNEWKNFEWLWNNLYCTLSLVSVFLKRKKKKVCEV